MVANFAHSPGSIRKAVEAVSAGKAMVQSNNSLQGSFRGTLDALKEGKGTQLVENLEEKLLPNMDDEKVQEDPPSESTEKILLEIETYLMDELNLVEMEDVLNTLPSELVNQISTFITTIKSGENQLDLEQVTDRTELIGLLLITTKYAEDYSTHQKDALLNLLKKLKVTASEMVPLNPQSAKVTTDLRAQKLIHELIQNVEYQLTRIEKPLTETQSRFQYLQTVHARYFSAPKGIETTQTVITDKQAKNVSNTTQINVSTHEMIPLNETGSNQVSKVEQFSIFVEQNNKPLPNQQQFIRQFQNILTRSSFLNSGGQQKLLINLYPEHLGSLRIELLQTEAGMIARIMASTSQAKELIESQLTNLRHTFIAQNISVEKIEVTTQLQYQAERSLQRENEHEQGQQSGRQQKDQNKQEHSEDQSFTSTLLNELVNTKV